MPSTVRTGRDGIRGAVTAVYEIIPNLFEPMSCSERNPL
jgi:hypothetical protein